MVQLLRFWERQFCKIHALLRMKATRIVGVLAAMLHDTNYDVVCIFSFQNRERWWNGAEHGVRRVCS